MCLLNMKHLHATVDNQDCQKYKTHAYPQATATKTTTIHIGYEWWKTDNKMRVMVAAEACKGCLVLQKRCCLWGQKRKKKDPPSFRCIWAGTSGSWLLCRSRRVSRCEARTSWHTGRPSHTDRRRWRGYSHTFRYFALKNDNDVWYLITGRKGTWIYIKSQYIEMYGAN